MGLQSPYPARIPLSVRPPRNLHVEAGGDCEIFVRIYSRGFTPAASTILFSGKLYKLENL